MAADQSNLTELQKHIIFEQGTEAPFTNKYWDHDKDGIYVDVISGKALFSSKDKFNSGSGWPSFTKAIDESRIDQKIDNSHNMQRVEVRAKDSGIHLGHVFEDGPKEAGGKRYCINSAALDFIDLADLQKAVLAGGCFWGMEELFSKLDGVIDVVNGYAGGHTPNPTYQNVSLGVGNYAETIEVTFNSKKISYEDIIRFFFKIHNPTTLNQQGNDTGVQYRSVIFYLNEQQKTIATDLIVKADSSGVFPGKIVTALEKLDTFYKAEEYHQDYLEKHPNGYTCHRIRQDWTF